MRVSHSTVRNAECLCCKTYRIDVLIADGRDSFPVVMVGGVLEANRNWDIGTEVIDSVLKAYSGACPVRPKVCVLDSLFQKCIYLCYFFKNVVLILFFSFRRQMRVFEA